MLSLVDNDIDMSFERLKEIHWYNIRCTSFRIADNPAVKSLMMSADC